VGGIFGYTHLALAANLNGLADELGWQWHGAEPQWASVLFALAATDGCIARGTGGRTSLDEPSCHGANLFLEFFGHLIYSRIPCSYTLRFKNITRSSFIRIFVDPSL
jgi:hypothetical protein